MGLGIMVTKLQGNSLRHYTEAVDLMPRARESSGAEKGLEFMDPNSQEAK